MKAPRDGLVALVGVVAGGGLAAGGVVARGGLVAGGVVFGVVVGGWVW